MIGGCYLTEETDDLKNFYNIGTDILTYKNLDEFIFNLEELVVNQNLRNKLRENGQNQALNELSIPVSIQKILSKL
jgi:spore maturation protein CgeB